MHNKDKVIFDKQLPYEYNICLYILEELCDKGVIDAFEMTEAIILLRKKYKMPLTRVSMIKKMIIPPLQSGYQGKYFRGNASVSCFWIGLYAG